MHLQFSKTKQLSTFDIYMLYLLISAYSVSEAVYNMKHSSIDVVLKIGSTRAYSQNKKWPNNRKKNFAKIHFVISQEARIFVKIIMEVPINTCSFTTTHNT